MMEDGYKTICKYWQGANQKIPSGLALGRESG
jgi:hypothetical protein